MKTLTIIPSRLSATRLPGKPLLKINGISIISHVFKRAQKANIGDVFVATEDKEIFDDVVNNGGQAILTHKNHKTGTDRIYEALQKLKINGVDLIMNLQGDEPNIDGNDIINLNYMRKMAGLNEIETDDDDYSDKPGYKEMPMFDQLGKIIDSDEMSKDGDDIKNPKATVKTDDGSEIEVSVDEAKAVRKMLNMLGSNRGADAKSPREKFLDA